MNLNLEKMQESVRLKALYEENDIIHEKLDDLSARLQALPNEYLLTNREVELLSQINDLIENEVCVVGIWEKLLTRTLIECKFSFESQVDIKEQVDTELTKAEDVLDDYLGSQPILDNGKSPKVIPQLRFNKQLTVALLTTFVALIAKVIHASQSKIIFMGNEVVDNKGRVLFFCVLIMFIFIEGLVLLYKGSEVIQKDLDVELESTSMAILFASPLFFEIKPLWVVVAVMFILFVVKTKRIKDLTKSDQSYRVAEKLKLINIYNTENKNLFFSDVPKEFWTHLNNTLDLIEERSKVDNSIDTKESQKRIELMFDKVDSYKNAMNLINSFSEDIKK